MIGGTLSEKSLKDILASSARSGQEITDETLHELANLAGISPDDVDKMRTEANRDAEDTYGAMPVTRG